MKRVLSIQSWVCHGYVGNKCSTFALQVLGLDVDPINTVHFSNHTGYPSWKGDRLSAAAFLNVMSGLKENRLDSYSHILTGYVGNAETLEAVVTTVREMKLRSPCFCICDPVMGDQGKLYVPESLVQIYRDKLVPLSDAVLPNQTECELLTGMKISNESEVLAAIDQLHALGPKTVIVKSTTVGVPGSIALYASVESAGRRKCYKVNIPQIGGYFSGAGDLFSSLFLFWNEQHSKDFPLVLQKTLGTLQELLRATYAAGSAELLLVQNRRCIEQPDTTLCQVELLE